MKEIETPMIKGRYDPERDVYLVVAANLAADTQLRLKARRLRLKTGKAFPDESLDVRVNGSRTPYKAFVMVCKSDIPMRTYQALAREIRARSVADPSHKTSPFTEGIGDYETITPLRGELVC